MSGLNECASCLGLMALAEAACCHLCINGFKLQAAWPCRKAENKIIKCSFNEGFWEVLLSSKLLSVKCLNPRGAIENISQTSQTEAKKPQRVHESSVCCGCVHSRASASYRERKWLLPVKSNSLNSLAHFLHPPQHFYSTPSVIFLLQLP